ncbi:hypothetical protein TWF970_008607 [Orbilia oligospora]|uniref:Uncharacterized protein n=1 Tax=Orbilia oligospora TaxID=2813651 RepID=A0A7C8RGZ1_ORBOL|nr:hypothetical protein TWF970_008607 [Orbilia oligospora]
MSKPTDPYGDHGGWKSGETGAKIGQIARNLWDSFTDWERKKENFPRSLTQRLWQEYPGWNIAVFHHPFTEYYFVNGAHHHIELKGGPFDSTFGYEVWVFESGYLCRWGPGGWKNWACLGYLYSPGTESRVIFTNEYGNAKAVWNEIMDEKVHMNKPLLQRRCDENSRRFRNPYWDSHEWANYETHSGDLPERHDEKRRPWWDDIPVLRERVDAKFEEKVDDENDEVVS